MQVGDSLEEFLLAATPDPKLRQVMMSLSEAIRTIAFKVCLHLLVLAMSQALHLSACSGFGNVTSHIAHGDGHVDSKLLNLISSFHKRCCVDCTSQPHLQPFLSSFLEQSAILPSELQIIVYCHESSSVWPLSLLIKS